MAKTPDSLNPPLNSTAQVTGIVVGAGVRGFSYACFAIAYKNKLKIVGVADPKHHVRKRCSDVFQLSQSMVFESWKDIADRERLAAKGYHILLEKPMAINYEDCCEVVNTVRKHGVLFVCCHVLRYYPQYNRIKELIESGAIGDVCNINHTVSVGFWKYAHSFVRGNWRREDESSCSLLAKCCHDLDLISYWMGGNQCKRISSFGSLMHFKKENKPNNATDNCYTCPANMECVFSAPTIYLNKAKEGKYDYISSVVCADIEELEHELKTSPYSRCVYNCDNDVMSNQVVNMQFENGATAVVNMVAFTKSVCARETVISGTKGELRCIFSGPVKEFNFLTKTTIDHMPKFPHAPYGLDGHGGADFLLIQTFIDAVIANDQSQILAGPEETLHSHYLVFAAEKARLENCVVELNTPDSACSTSLMGSKMQ